MKNHFNDHLWKHPSLTLLIGVSDGIAAAEEESGPVRVLDPVPVLHFLKDMVDWCVAGLVDIGGSAKESRHCACMDFDGEDLVIVSRSGDQRASSAHDGNLILFHRVKNFRKLVY